MIQITMQFALADGGWSETHYLAGDDLNSVMAFQTQRAGYQTLIPAEKLADLINARLGIMPYSQFAGVDVFQGPGGAVAQQDQRTTDSINQYLNPRLIRVRAALHADANLPESNFRRVRIYIAAPNQQYGTFYPNTGATSGTQTQANWTVEEWTRLLLVTDLSSNNQGHIFIGGAPESQLGPPNRLAITGPYFQRLRSYFTRLIADGWMTRLRPYWRQLTAPVAVPLFNFQVAADGKTATLQATDPTYSPPPQLQGQLVIRTRHPSSWNGVHRYQYITPPAGSSGPLGPYFLVGPARGPLGDWAPPNQGNIQLMLPQYVGYLAIFPERWDKRPLGPTFGRPVGRRKRPT